MRADIDFSKLSGTQLSKGKRTLIFTLYFLLIVILATLSAVYAYFTSTAAANGNLYFGEISVGFYDKETVLTSNSFKAKFANLTPGDTLDLSNINIKNTGTHSAYVLVNVDIEITNEGSRTLHYNQWYSIQGEEVNINDMTANTAKATRIAKDSSESTFIKWKVPSGVLSNEYQGATASVTLSAYASQVNLDEAENYVDADLYASYYICKTATYTAESMDVLTTYNGSKVSGEPLMKIDETEDVIDYDTMKVTRNIQKIELTGNEYWNEGNAPTLYFNLLDSGYGAGESNAVANVVCSHAPSTNSGENFYAVITNAEGTCIGFANCFEGFGVSNLEEFTTYLAEQYAKGTPVTLWYKLTSPLVDNINTNKNIYQGSQILHYETNSENNNFNNKGIVSITKGEIENYSEMELGGNIFEYLYDKEFVISYKIKFDSNNNTQELHSTMGFYIKDGNNLVYQHGIAGSNISYEENKWIYHYMKVPALSSLESSSDINHYRLMLANYTAGDVVNFEIKDIQIEIGSSPTDYELYDKTAYVRVNGTVLRAVGEVKDTYNTSSKEITRRIGRYEFTGNEALNKSGTYTTETGFAVNTRSIVPKPLVGSNVAACSIGVGLGAADSNYNLFRTADNGFKINTNEAHFLKISVSIIDNWDSSATDNDKLTLVANYLKKLKANGEPVTVWYELASTSTETV